MAVSPQQELDGSASVSTTSSRTEGELIAKIKTQLFVPLWNPIQHPNHQCSAALPRCGWDFTVDGSDKTDSLQHHDFLHRLRSQRLHCQEGCRLRVDPPRRLHITSRRPSMVLRAALRRNNPAHHVRSTSPDRPGNRSSNGHHATNASACSRETGHR